MKLETRMRASRLFGALSHPTRIAIIEHLREGESTVGALAVKLAISQPNTSQHLSILTRVGLLDMDPRGTSRFYRLRGPRLPRILDLIEEFSEVHSFPQDEVEALLD